MKTGGNKRYLPIKYKYLIFTTLFFIVPYIILMFGYIVQTENQQKELYIKNKIEILKKSDYLYSSLSNGTLNNKVYHEFLISSLNGYSDIIIISEDKEEIFFSNNNHILKKQEYFKKLGRTQYNSYEIDYLNVHRLLMYSYDNETKKYYIIIEPSKNVLDGIKDYSQSIFIVMILSAVLLLVITYLYSNKISSTLYSLIEIVKNYRNHKNIPSIPLDTNSRSIFNDELYDIENEIYETINYVVERENNQTQAFYKSKLENLQNQINPHFLYNTLENINQLAMMNDIEEISKLSRGLANLFRYNTEDRKHITTLKNELYIISEYLNIMKIRFPTIIYNLKIDDEYLLDTEIIKFTLQPLIENIFKHQRITEDFVISIFIYIKNNSRFIEIYTNQPIGNNINIRKVNYSINKAEDDETSGIGLSNVNKRIQLHYGENYGIYLKFIERRILVTTVLLPL